ncbi:hypothetical protein HC251_11680 [Iamia sp. SCSIO 61187]|uniref:nitrate- and nitrite sensing domain-containing protein n=1 Tax=Iamia sp. SCSIO 61187 TaxID=2722752 RepID=UPI001C62667D|nr:nitrate- and nitrite sensing domain-containing protein [Iamia sp. SCSIO 61187]QYG93027.1 hypothetical protein HC251_11680 [Iamia sp. SCSIO 61187]
MFDRLSIRTKLIAIVAAPLAVIIGLAGLGYTQRSDEASTTRADAVRLQAIVAAQSLQHEVQLEALYSVAYLAGPEDAPAEALEDLEAQQARVDAAAEELDRAIGAVEGDDTAAAANVSAQRAVAQVANSLRDQVAARSLEWAWVESLYRNALNSLPPVSNRLVASINEGSLAQGARTVVALGEYTTSQARIGVILAGAAGEGRFPEIDSNAGDDTDADEATGVETDPVTGQPSEGVSSRSVFLDAVEQAEVELAVVSSQAGSRIRSLLRNRMVGGDLTYFSENVDRVSQLAADATITIDPDQWTSAVEATLDELRSIAGAEVATVLGAAAERVDDADRAARLFLGGALIAVLAALLVAIAVSRSIARPVLNLTAAADRVAHEQLPRLVDALRNPSDGETEHLRPEIEEIDVRGGRELAQLSAAVSQIQETAVNVATEQATTLRKGIGDMFVNLARRNQGLLDRQLEFIDELEAQEDDPDQLEHLFKLDHMATRMRRNAESLLVLAGVEPGRRRGKPVPLTKVALAAVGEIEHFARIDLLDVDESEVISTVAADLAHLLSELMENATQFSPPDSRVEVVGHGNNGGGYTVSITDQGIGMSADQLAEANALLTRPPLLGLALSRSLGFIVVGRLAARHGIAVRLVPSPAGGVTSIVTIPSNVLVPQLDTVDLSDPVGDRGPSAPAGEAPRETISTPSSILPPFELYSGPADDPSADPEPADAPATLAEALPTGSALDDALLSASDHDALAPSSTAGPEPLLSAGARADEGRASSGPLFGPPPADPVRAEAPPTDPERASSGPAPGPRLFGSGSRSAEGSLATGRPAPGGAHLFRSPGADRAPADRAPADRAPSAPTGPTRGPGPVPSPPTRTAAPADGAGPAPLPTRARSGAAAPPAPHAPLPGEPPVAPLPTRTPPVAPPLPSRVAVPTPAAPPALPVRAPAPVASAPGAAAAVPPAGNGSGNGSGDGLAPPEVTSSGLVKRVPRRAGATRAVPGSDGPGRGPATTSSRSPEEVRAMLSRFHSGKQAGQAPGAAPPVPDTPPSPPEDL